MSHKVKNERLANMVVGVSTENVQFDVNGIGEIKCENIYKLALELPGFYPVIEQAPPDNGNAGDEDKKEEATEDSKPTPDKKTDTKK